jgi:drug/metabolite transporter (DMT)-like permease
MDQTNTDDENESVMDNHQQQLNNNNHKPIIVLSKIDPKRVRSLLCAVIFGQIISIIVAASNVFLKLLVEKKKVEYSFFQNALGYGLIAIVFGLILRKQQQQQQLNKPTTTTTTTNSTSSTPSNAEVSYEPVLDHTPIMITLPTTETSDTELSSQPQQQQDQPPQQRPRTLFAYLIFISILDSFAGYSDVLAYQFGESISSLGLLASFTIPSSMFFSFFLLKSRFNARHFIGVFIAMFGMGLVILIDAEKSSSTTATNNNTTSTTTDTNNNMKWAGDLLVLVGSAVYALDNVLSERLLKNTLDWKEFLFYLGSFGFMFSIFASIVSEWDQVLKTPFLTDFEVDLYLFAYAVTFLAMYGLIAKYFIMYDAVAMNLSLLTTSVWGAICDLIIFNEMLNGFTLFGFFFIVGGITLYHTKARSNNLLENGMDQHQHHHHHSSVEVDSNDETTTTSSSVMISSTLNNGGITTTNNNSRIENDNDEEQQQQIISSIKFGTTTKSTKLKEEENSQLQEQQQQQFQQR